MEIRSLFRFAFAREFHEQGYPIARNRSRLERFGGRLCSLVGGGLHLALREITNPVTIVALTAIATLVATAAFYPLAVLAIVPGVSFVAPWMVKATIFAVFQASILGLGLRTLGRLGNTDLVQRWNRGELDPVYLGSKRVSKWDNRV